MAGNKNQVAKDIVFRIRRFNPETDDKPYYQDYTINVIPGMTILDGLNYIRENMDNTLSWRVSCRMGVCGSCAMMVNGKPMLACNNQILNVTDTILALAPLVNFDIIKDLVPDLSEMFQKHVELRPYLHREDTEERENPTGEFWQSEEQLEEYLQFTYCIRCGACMAACPTLATDMKYMGPMPLAQSFRWEADSRDQGFEMRKLVAGDDGGVFSCHYAGECSSVCPKGVDPARAIQLMKKKLVKDYFKFLKSEKKQCEVLPHNAGRERRPEIPEAPARTVKK